MSAVEIAVKKVKGLSESQAKELLAWLAAHPPRTAKTKVKNSKRARKRRPQTMRELRAWLDSVRLTTDWEIPRMPPDLVKPPPPHDLTRQR